MHANVNQLRLQTRALLAATQRGETVDITYRGKPCARLIGVVENDQKTRPERNPAFGLWADQGSSNGNDVESQVRRLRAPRNFEMSE